MEARVIDRFRRHRLGVLGLLFMAYVGYYFCRVSFNVAMPELEEQLLSEADTGWIISIYFAVYGISKLLNGFLGDKVGGKSMLLLGIVGTVVCNVAFGLGQELNTFLVVWAVNAFFQSMGWLAMMSCTSQWYPSAESGRAIGALSLSYALGDVLARASGAFLISDFLDGHGWDWRLVFWVHAAFLLMLGIVLWKVLEPKPSDVGLPDVDTYAREAQALTETAEADLVPPTPTTPYALQLFRMLCSRWLWLVCTVYLALSTLRYIFWTWSIGYLKASSETLGSAGAVLTSAVYPLLGALGTIFAGWVSDRMGARRGPVILLMCILLVPAIYTFSTIAKGSTTLLAINLGAIGFLLYGPYALMAGAMAIDLGSKYSSASAAGIIDAIGAIGAVIAGAGMGSLIEAVGWNSAFGIVILIALGAALLSITMWNFKPLAHADRTQATS